MEVITKIHKIVDGRVEYVSSVTRETINSSQAPDSSIELFAAESTHTYYQINIDDDIDTTLNKISLMTEIPQNCILLTDPDLKVIGHHYRYLDRHKTLNLNLGNFVGKPRDRYKETSIPGICFDAKIVNYFRKGNIVLESNVKEVLGTFLIPESDLCFGEPIATVERPAKVNYELYVFDIRSVKHIDKTDNDLIEGFVRVLWPSAVDGARAIQPVDEQILHYLSAQKYINLLDSLDQGETSKWVLKNELNRAIIKVLSSAKEDDIIWNLRMIFDNFELSDMFPCIAIYDGTQRATNLRALKSFIENDFVKYDKIRKKYFNNPFFRIKLWTNYENGFGRIDIYKNGEMTLNITWSYSGFGGVNCVDKASKVFDVLRQTLLQIPHSRVFVLPRPFIIQETEQRSSWEINSFNVTVDFLQNRPNSSLFRLLMLSFPHHITLSPHKENQMIFGGEYLRAGLRKSYESQELVGVKFELKHHISMRILEIKSMHIFEIICRFVIQIAQLSSVWKQLPNSQIKQLIDNNIRQLEQKYPLLRREVYKDTDNYKELRIRRLQRNDSQLFSFHKYVKTTEQSKYKPYSKLCQGKAQPLVLSSLKEVRDFSQQNKHFTHHLEVTNKTNGKKDYYVCPHKKYPFPGFKDPKLHPKGFCLPCCKKISSIENPKSVNFIKYQSCLNDTTAGLEKNTYNPNYVKLYGKPVREMQLGRLPEDLFYELNRKKRCIISSSHQLQKGSDCYLLTNLGNNPNTNAIKIQIQLHPTGKMTLHLPDLILPDQFYQVIFTDENGNGNIIQVIEARKQSTFAGNSELVTKLQKIAKKVIKTNESALEKVLKSGSFVPPTIFNVEYIFRSKLQTKTIFDNKVTGFFTENAYLPILPEQASGNRIPTANKLPTWEQLQRGIKLAFKHQIKYETIVAYSNLTGKLFGCLLHATADKFIGSLLVKFVPEHIKTDVPVLRDETNFELPATEDRSVSEDRGARASLDANTRSVSEDMRTRHIAAINAKLMEYYDLIERISEGINSEKSNMWRTKYLDAYKKYITTKNGNEFKKVIKTIAQNSPQQENDYMLVKWITLQISKQLSSEGKRPPVEWVSNLLESIVLEQDKKIKYQIRTHIIKKDVASIKSILHKYTKGFSENVVDKVVFDLIHNILRREQILNNTIPYHSELILGENEILEVISLS